MRKTYLLIVLCCFYITKTLAQDPAPTSPTAISPNYTWYKKILQGDTSIFAYSNGMWANIARREWVRKAIKDSLSKDKFVPYLGAKANLNLGEKALLAGSIVATTAGISGSFDGKSLNLSSPTLGTTEYLMHDIKRSTNGFTKTLNFGELTGNRLISLPDKGGVLAVDGETIHNYGDEVVKGVKTFEAKPIVPGITRSDGAQPLWNAGTTRVLQPTLEALSTDYALRLISSATNGNGLYVRGGGMFTGSVEVNEDLTLHNRITLYDRIQATNDKFYIDNFNGYWQIASSINGGRYISIHPDGKVNIGSQATPTSSSNQISFRGTKILNVATNKLAVFQGDTLSNLEATSIKNQATLNSGFLKTDGAGLLISGGYTPANAANVISKTGYADQVFDGNLGAGDGYIQSTNSGSGRIGRFHGSMFSDIGTINNLNLATNGGLDATLSAINNINLVTGADHSVRANSFTVSGLTGPGIRLTAQPSAHAVPGLGQHDIYADASGRFTIMGSNGIAASLGTAALTENRVYELPNAPGTLALKENPVSTFSNDAGYITSNTGDSRYLQLSGTYNNPSWLGSIAYGKVSSVPANTILANNTGNTGTAAGITYVDNGQQLYTGSIIWTGTTAPSGTTTHSYQWTQIGKQVTLRVTLAYTTAGSGITEVLADLPADMPSPILPTGFTSIDNVVSGYGGFQTAIVNPITAAARASITQRSGSWKIRMISGIVTPAVAQFNFIYYTN